ncbi:hypothetical protein [Streptomyces sp. MUM 178J]|uniref:hypothetical protein n=1 Tax=Streptomyces sp. MUM 178J TaxID=2791991 RepID=UPI001F0483E1|nr:hypothetical protein [Streptomyces sp. MUM 178J]WRQ83045.1 hypothetical protein I3F59_028895 [Streptomyces sp. MUM 178J]
MAPSDKWQALLADAETGTERGGTGMRLASTEDGGSGGGNGGGSDFDLKSSKGPWTTASGVAGALHTSSSSALTELETASKGVADNAKGLDSTSALAEVLTSWKGRLTAVRNECDRLEAALKTAGKEFGEREVQTRQDWDRQRPHSGNGVGPR